MKLIYICTPLKGEKFLLDKIQKALLAEDVFGFIPPTGQLNSKKLGAELDRKMISLCDELWAFGLLGRDCAWEVGYATGLGKKVRIFKTKENQELIDNDWMTVIGAEIIELE